MNPFHSLIEIIFPSRCPVCEAFLGGKGVVTPAGELPICETCFNGFVKIGPPRCPICGIPFFTGMQEDHVCEECLRKRPFFLRARAPYLYQGGLMTAIHRFKYGGRSHFADTLGPLLASFAGAWLGEREDLLVMPVPLHPKRLRERGFNQSLLLARHVASALAAELDFLSLRRTKHTIPQTGLKAMERRKNVRKAFQVATYEAVKGRAVLLVDDVATTGNTLNECARVLRKAGASEVFSLVLARTSTGWPHLTGP